MAIPLSYSWRNLWVRRSTTLATSGGIALVVFVLASSLMLASGVRETLANSGSDDKVIITQRAAYAEVVSRINQAVLNVVVAAPGIEQTAEGQPLVTAESVTQVMLPLAGDPEHLVSLQVRGVASNVFEVRPEVSIVAGRAPVSGTEEAAVGVQLLGRYRGLELGGQVEIQQGRPVRIVGAFAAKRSAYESEIWADLHAVQTATESVGYVSSITARLASRSDYEAFATAIETGRKEEGLLVERERGYYERLSSGLSTFIGGLGGLVTIIFSLGAMLGAAITMYGAVGRRTKEVGVLKALGFSAGHVLLAFMFESVGLAVLGSAAGVTLALGTSFIHFSTVNVATGGAEIAFRFVPSLLVVVGSAAAGTIVGTVGGFFPAIRAARIDPIQAIRA